MNHTPESSYAVKLFQRAAEFLWTPELLVHVCGKQIVPVLPYIAVFAPAATAEEWAAVQQETRVDMSQADAAFSSLPYQCIVTLAGLPPLLDTRLLCTQRPIRTEAKLDIDRLLAKAQSTSSAEQYAVLMEKVRELSYLRHPEPDVPDHWCAHRLLMRGPYLAERLIWPLALDCAFGVVPYVLHSKGVLSVVGPHDAVQQYLTTLQFIDAYGQSLLAELPKQRTAQLTQTLRASLLYHFTASCTTHLLEHIALTRGHCPRHGFKVPSAQPADIRHVRLKLSRGARNPACRAKGEIFGVQCAHEVLEQLHSGDGSAVLYVSDTYEAA